jgi:hypothetical protein
MSIEEAITAYLLSRPGLTALIGTRFHFDELEQDKPNESPKLPAVVCSRVSDVKTHTLTGQLTLERPVFQFTALAKTKAACRAVTDQMKAALVDYQGTLSGIEIQKIELQNEMNGLEKSSDGTMKIYTEDLEFEINYVKE